MAEASEAEPMWRRHRSVLASVLLGAVVAGLVGVAVVETSALYALLLGLGVLGGYVACLVFVYGVASNLRFFGIPSFVAWVMWVLALLPWRDVVLAERPDGTYRFEHGDEWDGDRSDWGRWLYGRFTTGVEITADTFESAVGEDDVERPERDRRLAGDGGVGVYNSRVERGGERLFYRGDLVEVAREQVIASIPETLSELRDSAGLRGAFRAESEALEEHGGDTGGLGDLAFTGAMFGFLLAGVLLGHVLVW